MSQPPGFGFVRVGPPVYRNPIEFGNVRPTIKQRLGPRNYSNVVRVGPHNHQFRPYAYRGRGRGGRGHQSRYTWAARNNEQAGVHRMPVAERIGRTAHERVSIGQDSSYSTHDSSSNNHGNKCKSRAASHDQRRKRSSSTHRSRDRTRTPTCSQEDEASSIVVSRDLREGKRVVQYDAKSPPGANKEKERREKELSKSSHSKADSKNDQEKPKAKSSPETKSENSSVISQLVGANPPGAAEMMVIESISGCSSADEKEDEEDVEVLQLRREALEAMIKKVDEARSPDSKKANTNASTGTSNVLDTPVNAGSTVAASAESTMAGSSTDIDENSLREKLLVDMSRKRKLNSGKDSKRTDSPNQNVPSKKPPSKAVTPVQNSAPKHSPIKFPTSQAVSVEKPAAKYFDLRDTMRNKPNHATTSPFVSKVNAHSSRSQRSSSKPVYSPNRVFSRKYLHEEDMGTLKITIPNDKKVIVPLNVPSTDEEEDSSDLDSISSDNDYTSLRLTRRPNKFDSRNEHHWEPIQSTSTANFNSESPAISPEQLPESFQRKLAQLLRDAWEDSRRSMENETKETKTASEKQKKEKIIENYRKQAEKIAEEEELLRKEKEKLAIWRSRRLLNKTKPSISHKNAQPTSSPKIASHAKSPSGPQPGKSPDAAPTKATNAAKSNSPQPFDAKSSFQALKHLPIHKQVEYIRLQSQILEHEHKLSEARFSLGLSEVQGMSVQDVDVVFGKPRLEKTGEDEDENDNQPSDINVVSIACAASENGGEDAVASEIEALSQREKALKAKLIENMEKSQNHLALKAKENELINARKATCDAMAVLVSAILKRSHSKMACRHMEEKITLLQYQLKVTTDSLREEQCRLDASTSAIENATRQTNEMKEQCQSLEEACGELGKKAKGSEYTVTKVGYDNIKRKETEIERTSKVGTPSPKKSRVVSGSPRTPIQLFRLKSVARAVKRQQSYNWRKTNTPVRKKRDSMAEGGMNPPQNDYLGKPETDDEEEIFILPRHNFTNVLIKTKPQPTVQKKTKIGMSKYEEYVSPLQAIKGEDNGYLQQQMTGMAIEKVHPAVTLCIFELRAFCNSEACSFQHLYRPGSAFSFH